jgi:hypothetical protein
MSLFVCQLSYMIAKKNTSVWRLYCIFVDHHKLVTSTGNMAAANPCVCNECSDWWSKTNYRSISISHSCHADLMIYQLTGLWIEWPSTTNNTWAIHDTISVTTEKISSKWKISIILAGRTSVSMSRSDSASSRTSSIFHEHLWGWSSMSVGW